MEYNNHFINDRIILTNIQHFSLHDGPGIRTTVFLKGCTVHCPWCSNPENLSYKPETYVRDGVAGVYGREISCEELYKILIKDKAFYDERSRAVYENNFYVDCSSELDKLPGGVTFSGGEALAQADKLVPLLNKLKTEHIHMVVETSLFISSESLNIALEYIDLFYIDAKIIDENYCRKVLHGELRLYLQNLDMLFSWRSKEGHKKPVIIRVPVIGGFTDYDANRQAVVELVSKYKPLKVELIKEHNLGTSKYESLGMQLPVFKSVSDDLMQRYKCEIAVTGVPTEICTL